MVSKHGFNLPDKAFKSDGCSGYLSKLWRKLRVHNPPFERCCYEHDIEYHYGSGQNASWWEMLRERLGVDNRFAACVWRHGLTGKVWAPLVWIGVRIGGWAHWPTPFRWGFGWKK